MLGIILWIYSQGKEFSIKEEIMEQVGKLSGNKRLPILGNGYPFFEWSPGIEINETIENY